MDGLPPTPDARGSFPLTAVKREGPFSAPGSFSTSLFPFITGVDEAAIIIKQRGMTDKPGQKQDTRPVVYINQDTTLIALASQKTCDVLDCL